MMFVSRACILGCLVVGGCGTPAIQSFTPEQIQIIAEGITSDDSIELIFALEGSQDWSCPGVNVVRQQGGRIDVYFLRVKKGTEAAPSPEIPATRSRDDTDQLVIRIPYDVNSQSGRVELFLDGKKSLGAWKLKEKTIESEESSNVPMRTGLGLTMKEPSRVRCANQWLQRIVFGCRTIGAPSFPAARTSLP